MVREPASVARLRRDLPRRIFVRAGNPVLLDDEPARIAVQLVEGPLEVDVTGAELEGFFDELDGYSGWLVVEQDWVPGPDEDPAGQIAAQARNRRWLANHAGL